MKFAVFDKDGNPVRAGVCPEGKIDIQAKEGETAIEWPADLGPVTSYKLIDGRPEQQ